jgi:hypothetical protein
MWVFLVVLLGEAGEAFLVDLVFGGGGDDAVGDGAAASCEPFSGSVTTKQP